MEIRTASKRSVGFQTAFFGAVAVIVLLAGCATAGPAYYYSLSPGDGVPGQPATPRMSIEADIDETSSPYDPLVMQMNDGTMRINTSHGELTGLQENVLSAAHRLLGTAPNATVTVRGKTYVCDCIGSVGAIFYDAGIDIFGDLGPSRGGDGGVDAFYRILEAEDVLHTNRLPAVGDVIFWDNTYDRNSDGIIGNDPNTHVGIVVQVEKDGTIHYLHENQFTGIVVERMNLYQPDVHRDPITGKLLNSPMFDGSYEGNPNNPEHWLAGDLWKEFGGVLQMVDDSVPTEL